MTNLERLKVTIGDFEDKMKYGDREELSQVLNDINSEVDRLISEERSQKTEVHAACTKQGSEQKPTAPAGMGSLEAWESEAEAFYKASGYLRPGKDPGIIGDEEYIQRRDRAWSLWCGGWNYRDNLSPISEAKVGKQEEPLAVITALCKRAYETSKSKGWKHDNDGQAIALMHSELSEALEAMRKPDHKDEHLPNLDPVGLELADVLIRVLDFCGAREIDLATCLKAKMDYNDSRPMKHGGKLF